MLALSRNFQNGIWQSNLPATPSLTAEGTQLTAHATIHTKGTYATLMTTTYPVYGFWIMAYNSAVAGTQTDQLLDIATGPNQENIIVPNDLSGWRSNTLQSGTNWKYYPIFIPSGTLVSARIQALITVDTLQVAMIANAGGSAFPGQLFTGCDVYGINAAASQGTSHTPGNTGSESTAADIGSPTSRDYGAVMLGIGGSLANVTLTNMAYHWKLVMGGQNVCEWMSSTSANEIVYGPFLEVPFYVSIPAGIQLQVKAKASGTAVPQDVALYCYY